MKTIYNYISGSVTKFIETAFLASWGGPDFQHYTGRGSAFVGAVVVFLSAFVGVFALWLSLWLGFSLGFTM